MFRTSAARGRRSQAKRRSQRPTTRRQQAKRRRCEAENRDPSRNRTCGPCARSERAQVAGDFRVPNARHGLVRARVVQKRCGLGVDLGARVVQKRCGPQSAGCSEAVWTSERRLFRSGVATELASEPRGGPRARALWERSRRLRECERTGPLVRGGSRLRARAAERKKARAGASRLLAALRGVRAARPTTSS